MAHMQKSSRDGAAGTSIFEKGSPANAVLAVIMAVVMAISLMPLPGFSAQAYAKEGDVAAGTSSDVTGGDADDNAEDLPGIVVAPLVDHGVDAKSDENISMNPDTYEVSVAPSEYPDIYNVDITAVGVKQHYNGRHDKAYWVGIGIPAGDDFSYAVDFGKYPDEEPAFSPDTKDGSFVVGEQRYDTFYFGTRSTLHGKKGYVAVKAGEDKDASITVYNISFENVKLVYDITIDPIKNGKIDLIADEAKDKTIEPAEEAVEEPAGTAIEGDHVKFKVTPERHYLLNEVKATYKEGETEKKCDIIPANEPATDDEAIETQASTAEVVAGAGEDEESEEDLSAGQEFAIVMPAAPVTLSATFTDIRSLEENMAIGEGVLKRVVESTDGSDVLSDQDWATAEERQPLIDELKNAKDLIASGTATEKDVAEASIAISKAGTALNNAAAKGTKSYKQAFEEELVEAQELLDNTPVSSDGSKVRNTEGWVTYKTKGVLEDAIAKAKKAEQGTYVDYRQAYTDLSTAVEDFKKAEKPGKVDSTGLDELITALEEELDEAIIADDPATVEAGKTFYTPESAADLQEAIDAATEVSQKADATKAEIDEAEEALQSAAEVFVESAQKGTKGTGIDISKATIAKIDDQVYTTKPIEPKVTVTLGEKELAADTDYTVAYEDNTEVGKATVTVTGAGEYAGEVAATFNITSAAEAAKATMPDLDEKAWYMGGDGTRGGYFPETNTLYLDYALARGLMSGYTKDGKVVGFGPNNTLKRAQTATVLYRMTHEDITPTTDPSKYEANKTGLSDVESYQYYTAAVNWAYAEGFMTGYTDDAGNPVAFGPDDPINREQIATTIGRWGTSPKGGDMPKPTKKASDLYDDAASISDWALEGAAFCNENGIMTGVGGTKDFNPKANTERCQMAKIIAVTDKLNSEK